MCIYTYIYIYIYMCVCVIIRLTLGSGGAPPRLRRLPPPLPQDAHAGWPR